jgi:membrane protein YdbS with pleckstrin-like domain
MSTDDPSQPDLAWRGHSGWAMLPSFVVCFLVSVALLTSGWFFEDIRGIGQEVGSWIFFQITAVIWIVQLLRWVYRGASYIYRLTPKFVYVDRGFLYSPVPAIPLCDVTKVTWSAGFFGRFLGVGSVIIDVEVRGPVTLTGLLQPAAFAEEIETAVAKAKAQSKASAVA